MSAVHGAGIKTNGTLWAWGVSDGGQVGLGTTANYSTPMQVGTLSNWAQVTGNYKVTLARKTDGTLWFWGTDDPEWFFSGMGTPNVRSSPVQVGASNDWTQISTGTVGTLAIRTGGGLWAWGRATNGALGIPYLTPTQVGTGTNWADVYSGYGKHTVALKTDGTLWNWGLNWSYQMGNGSNAESVASPIQVGTLTTWAKASAGGDYTTALRLDGTVWGWGYGGEGQLGNGTLGTRSTPVQVGAQTIWKDISSGTNHTLVLKR
jgi:alpha-tubulin suppressor-like RCC1 family protein